MKQSPKANRFGVDYRGNRAAGTNINANNRSGSRDRIPRVNNYTKVMSRISPARAEGGEGGGGGNTVFDRLYGRSKPSAGGARSVSRDRSASNGPANGGPPKANVGR